MLGRVPKDGHVESVGSGQDGCVEAAIPRWHRVGRRTLSDRQLDKGDIPPESSLHLVPNDLDWRLVSA